MSLLTRIFARVGFGSAAERAVKPRPNAIMAPVPLSHQLNRIGGSLTPQQVSAIIQEADTGMTYRLIDLENEARQKDCHLQSILATRELAVSGLSYEVVALDGAGARDKAAAAWVQERLQACDDFPNLIGHMQGAVYHGYSVTETIWARDAGDVVPVCFKPQAARRFTFDPSSQSLNWWDPSGSAPGALSSGGYPGTPLSKWPAGQFIIHQPRINGDIPCREGLGRVLMWAALFRNWAIRDWLSLAELAWKPWRTGSYEPSASVEDIDHLAEILLQMSSSGVATHKTTTKIEVHWPDGKGAASSSHGELVAFLAAEMSKAVQGQTLTTDAGERGARSLGEVHDGVRKDIREHDARSVAATLRRDLIAPMIRANYSAAVKVPILRFLTEDAPDVRALAEAYEKLTPLMRIPVSHVYDVTGIPEPKGDEEILGEYLVDTTELDESDESEDATEPDGEDAGGDEYEPEPEPETQEEPAKAA